MLTNCFMRYIVRTTAILLFLLIAFTTSCARMPSTERSAKILRSSFKKYGKKYPDTVYGKSHVKEVEITSRTEVHKHLVSVEAFITLEDGTVQRIYATVERGPMGWRFISWENATGM